MSEPPVKSTRRVRSEPVAWSRVLSILIVTCAAVAFGIYYIIRTGRL